MEEEKKKKNKLNIKTVILVFFIIILVLVTLTHFVFYPIFQELNRTGFMNDPEDETKIIYKNENHEIVYGSQIIEGNQYYFDDETGWMIIGIHKEDDGTRYYDENGIMYTGFLNLDDGTYYYDTEGLQVSGCQTIEEITYLFSEEGILQTNCFQRGIDGDDSHIFYFNENGEMVTGKTTVNEKEYYFNENGVLSVDIEYIQNGVEEIVNQYGGTISVYYKDLKSNQSFSVNDRSEYPASIIKLPTLIAVYQAIAEGTLEKTSTLEYYINAMIRVSDNFAYNYLCIQLGNGSGVAGVQKITALAQSLGMENTRVVHGLEPADNYFTMHGMNTSSAQDVGIALEAIYNYQVATPELCDEMIEVLKSCSDNTKLASGLPSEVEFAHKTGYTEPYYHDGGIVYTSNGDYIITCFTTSTSSYTSLMKKISSFIYEYEISYLPEGI